MYFSLKEPNSEKSTLIILRYFISKREGRFVFSTGLKILPQDWDRKSKMAIVKRGRSDLSSINRRLQEFVNFLDKTIDRLDIEKTSITKQVLKELFDREFKDRENRNRSYIFLTDFVNDFIEKAPNSTNRKTKRKYTSEKIREYKSTNKKILEFEKFLKKRIRIDGFDIKMYDMFCDYFIYEKGFAVNSVGTYVKNVKVFLSKAEEFGYHPHQDFKSSNFTVRKEKSLSIALNESEIERIFLHDFSGNIHLENCRDMAIIGLWTGLRVSDLINLPEINIHDEFIKVTPQKTKDSSGVSVVIPLHHHIKEVIRKRGMPRMLSKFSFNMYIKDVCKEVGLVERVKGGMIVKDLKNETYRKKVDFFPKYKLISSHTCRRSFATNLYNMNFPVLSIMQITGHTTEHSFLTYIKVTPTEHAEKLLAHWKEYYKDKKVYD